MLKTQHISRGISSKIKSLFTNKIKPPRYLSRYLFEKKVSRFKSHWYEKRRQKYYFISPKKIYRSLDKVELQQLNFRQPNCKWTFYIGDRIQLKYYLNPGNKRTILSYE